MEISPFHRLLKQAAFQLVVVATLGCVLRYKMLFPLPWLEQKHILHAHSHFAFTGWITQALYVLLVQFVWQKNQIVGFARYKWIFRINLLSAWGMLIGFALQGYGMLSTPFAGLSILTSYWFALNLFTDLKREHQKNVATKWIYTALLTLILSSIGTWYLAYLQLWGFATTQHFLLAIYGYLHFQYNGWFLFAVFALVIGYQQVILSPKTENRLWLGWTITCVPAYLLSALWLSFDFVELVLLAVVALLQLVAWGNVLTDIKLQRAALASSFWWLPITALTIKLILQVGSVYPPLSTLAFGIRPIVIGYLHLILLGIISLSILALFFKQLNATRKTFLWIFTGGVIINELMLLVQGGMALGYLVIPKIKYALLIPACLLLVGALGIWITLKSSKPA